MWRQAKAAETLKIKRGFSKILADQPRQCLLSRQPAHNKDSSDSQNSMHITVDTSDFCRRMCIFKDILRIVHIALKTLQGF